MKRRLLCLFLCLCLLITGIPLCVQAADPTGTVFGLDPDNKLYVRESASTSAAILDRLDNGDLVTILGSKTAGGIDWYKVRTHNDVVGYSSAAYIRENISYETNEEFEAYLTKQKFPEDYKAALRKLWAQHPTWVFKAHHLSITWAEALSTDAENKPLKNAVAEPESWKSMEKGTYDWDNKKYIAVDSGGWVTAAPAVVAYYMDPRNFLDETYVFQFEDLQYSDSQTVAGVKAILPSRYDQYAEDLIKAAKASKVSAYFLATRMAQEGSQIDGTFVGDDGTSYKDVYNFFNYGAYAGDQYGAYHGAVTNGAIYAQKQGWTTPYKCLVGSAEKIGSSYINKGQNTLYYQKFNVAGENLYNHQYMSNVQAPSSESKIRAQSATAAELASALTFLIPVYKEMPTEKTVLPGKTGNNNNFLDSLTANGCTLSPTFNRYGMDYTGVVDGDVTSIKISATKNESAAKVTGTGTIKLNPGENVIPITVTATSGQTRVYTLTILRDAEGGDSTGTTKPSNPSSTTKPTVPKPSLTGTSYTIKNTITGVEPDTSLATFIKKLGVKNGSVILYDHAGKEKKDGPVATGDILRVYDNEKALTNSYPVVIYGDVNGDGKINSQDLRRAQRHILGVAEVESYFFTAADTNRDGKVNSQDLRRTQRHILKILKTLQS